jgi:hypothetical protein
MHSYVAVRLQIFTIAKYTQYFCDTLQTELYTMRVPAVQIQSTVWQKTVGLQMVTVKGYTVTGIAV